MIVLFFPRPKVSRTSVAGSILKSTLNGMNLGGLLVKAVFNWRGQDSLQKVKTQKPSTWTTAQARDPAVEEAGVFLCTLIQN